MLIDAERKAERDSIQKIEAYKKLEKHAYRKIERERAATIVRSEKGQQEHAEIRVDLNNRIDNLKSELLEIEMKLQDAIGAARKTFTSKVKAIIDQMA